MVGLTSTAYFMVVLDSVVVITALPRMQRDLHVSLLAPMDAQRLRHRLRRPHHHRRRPRRPIRPARRLQLRAGAVHLGSPAGVTAGFGPALWACVVFAVLAAVTAFGISP
jgi:hypothetical protein